MCIMSGTCRALGVVVLVCLGSSTTAAPPPANQPAEAKMAFTGLAPSHLVPDLCVLKYPVSTSNPQCQAFFNQALGYFYSYVWMEAARSFETAARHDPDCALAWWGLSRALERWNKGADQYNKALLKANDLKDHASHREQQLILARMQEKGLAPNSGNAEARKQAAIGTIDNLLALYDDDDEAWYYRAQLAGGDCLFGGVAASAPFYKALVRVNRLHPGANHELLHYYEKCHRPALGWVYAEQYIQSSPGIPHPFHMQAHLATRLGRWDKTSDRSTHAIELERAYHKDLRVKPADDYQFPHHLEVLTLSLIHDGRFAEAHAIKKEVESCGWQHWLPWFKLHIAERAWEDALKVATQFRKSDKCQAAYLAALVYLRQGDTVRAAPEVEVLRQACQEKKNDEQLEFRLWEAQGRLLCQTGHTDAGLKLLAKAADRSKGNYYHHSWGNGAYYMEAWGAEALRAGRLDTAEEAFLEALAHDPGSVRGALGMQVVCERQGRAEEASRFAELAHRCWRRAEPSSLENELAALRDASPRSNQHAQRQAGNTNGTTVRERR
jgi:Tfp pilus assembly protein PilF